MTELREPRRARVEPNASRSVLVVPIRSFALGKARLAGELDNAARAALARGFADRVVDAAGDLAVVVVTSDAEVVSWARERRVNVIDDPGSLDGAAQLGVAWAAARTAERVVVAHADLPFAHDLAELARDGPDAVAIIVPDHRDDGTPVLSLPVSADFGFAYGPGSFVRHLAAAAQAGLRVVVHRDPDLGFDVDEPADLEILRARRAP